MWLELENRTLQAGTWDTGETSGIVRTLKKDSKSGVRAVRPQLTGILVLLPYAVNCFAYVLSVPPLLS